MNALIQHILPFLLLYKYGALFAITFIAAFIIPIPPGTIIMASSAFAYEGYLSFGWVLVVAIAGNILGDNAGYWLARTYGRKWLSKVPAFNKILNSERYQSIERRIARRPGFLIFISRFEVFTNLAVNLIAGLGKVNYRKFLWYEAIGEILQVALYGAVGYIFGSNWQAVSAIIGRSLLILIVLIILFVIVFWKRIWK